MTSRILFLMAGWLVAASVQAAGDLDVTMRMVTEDHDLTGSVVRQIELPRPADGRPSVAGDASPGRSEAADTRPGRPEGGRPESVGRPAMGAPERPVTPDARPALDLPDRPSLPDLPDAARGQRPNGVGRLRDALPARPGTDR